MVLSIKEENEGVKKKEDKWAFVLSGVRFCIIRSWNDNTEQNWDMLPEEHKYMHKIIFRFDTKYIGEVYIEWKKYTLKGQNI